jgi:signal recognition particle subunit SRP19
VGKADAVKNPLAKGLAEAAAMITPQNQGQTIMLEPGNKHPADWSNPGRIRVKVKNDSGKWIVAGGVKNSKFD